MTDDHITRLRDHQAYCERMGLIVAEDIKAVLDERDRLRRALEPFAQLGVDIPAYWPEHSGKVVYVDTADCRDAVAVLNAHDRGRP